MRVPLIHEADWKGILVNLFLVGVAAMNLALDFETICSLSAKDLPKYYELYFAFSFVVTLLWLYLEAQELIRIIGCCKVRNLNLEKLKTHKTWRTEFSASSLFVV